MEIMMIDRWLHIIAGVLWIGLLYYFNFVQAPAQAAALADKDGPGPAAIGKYIAPRALLWFRWAALATWVTGAYYLEAAPQYSLVGAFSLGIGAHNVALSSIGMGAWLGTIMLFNVWVLIWPNQKKILGIVEATDEEKGKAKRIAFLASRSNTLMSIPVLLFMQAGGHGMPF
ncbi:MAG: urate hydroxylase PuuD [Proteobacteria bacterium]|nr:urate hydroxylase PuuD [Pseudomonadota bacterium]MCZ6893428.1 urate hydroxylase PuuD [Gammaproteobacteria bacterium]